MAARQPATADSTTEDFVISRTFDAPRDLVWKMWTEPEHLAQWWGPKGCMVRVVQLDVRPGGMFHYVLSFEQGDEMWARFVYREVAPPERLIYVSGFSDAEGGLTRAPFPEIRDTFPLEILNALTFTESNGRTSLSLRAHPLNATAAEQATFSGMFGSMQQGFGGTFEVLAEYLAKMRATL